MRDKNEMLVDASFVQTFYAMLTTPIDRRAVRLAQDVIALVTENNDLSAQLASAKDTSEPGDQDEDLTGKIVPSTRLLRG